SCILDLRVMRSTPGKTVTKEDLEKTIEIILTETETMRFFNLPTVMVSVESEEAEKLSWRNKNYETLCRNRLGNDLYVERMMQTINGAPKNKEVQCDRIIKEDKGIMSTAWDLYDSYNAMELSSLPVKQPTIDSSISEGSSLMDIENVILAKIHNDEENHSDAVLKSDKFQQDLFFMERVIMENIFRPKLAAYRQLPVLKELEPEESEIFLEGEKLEEIEEEVKKEEEEEMEIGSEQSTIPANLERLWSFSCDLTKGLNVSSLAWNKTNPDLLAVGYGHFGFKEQKRGLACCWSIKNPMKRHSISTILLHVVNKINIFSLNEDLMRLRRTTSSTSKRVEKEKKGEALISRQAPGMCFAFHPKSVSKKNILTVAKFTNKVFHYSLDPLIVNVANPGIKFTTVLFAKQTDCLLVGDSDGQVAVYELRNMPTGLESSR
ncbi:WD repeat-containing protein 78, partial [Camelus dromedarius]